MSTWVSGGETELAVYEYEVINKSGEIVTGSVEAEQQTQAVDKLKGMGFRIIDLKEERKSAFATLFQFRQGVGIAELALFSRQLAAMLDAGVPLTRALYTLSEQSENQTMSKAVAQIASSVEGGMSLTESMRAHPKIFGDLYIGMIRAGEVGGTLEATLERLSDQLQKDKTLRDNIKSATFYPGVVAGFAVVLLITMLVFLVPVFMGFFPEGLELPFLTRMIIGLSESIRFFWYLYLMVIALLIMGVRYFFRSPTGKRQWDKVKFKLPVFGSLIHKATIARFSRTFATLVNGGIPVMQALETSGATSGSMIVTEEVKGVAEKIQDGKNIAEPLKETGLFPPMVVQMVAIGEETGALPDLLNKIAEFYEEEVATITKGLSSLLEPILLVIVGVVVGIMLVSLYLPIFTAVTQVGM